MQELIINFLQILVCGEPVITTKQHIIYLSLPVKSLRVQSRMCIPTCLFFLFFFPFLLERDNLLVERRTCDLKVTSSNPGRSGWRIFFSRVNFVCRLLFGVRSHPCVTAVARKRPRSFYQKCGWQATPKHAYVFDLAKWEWADYTAVRE